MEEFLTAHFWVAVSQTIMATAAMLRLTGSEKSTRFYTQMRTPSMPIMP